MTSRQRDYVRGAKPFLKWAGGKRGLLSQFQPYLPPGHTIGRYFEPFIGSAALFFHRQPVRATLSDINGALIDAYRVVQGNVEEVITALTRHHYDEGYFYEIRAQKPADLDMVERAARLIFLNRTCYNGLYRENKSGQFNVPFGRYENPTICDEPRLRRASRALRGVTLRNCDFSESVSGAIAGDLIYFDPPYVPLNETSNFTAYSAAKFDVDDQIRLAELFHQLVQRGCQVALSNSNSPLVSELYAGRGYKMVDIKARRSINSSGSKRGHLSEWLIVGGVDDQQ